MESSKKLYNMTFKSVFVGNEDSSKKHEAHIIELEAFALVQGPGDVDQVSGRGKNIKTDMMILSPSLGYPSSNLVFVTSFRTSIPERKELAQNEMS